MFSEENKARKSLFEARKGGRVRQIQTKYMGHKFV